MRAWVSTHRRLNLVAAAALLGLCALGLSFSRSQHPVDVVVLPDESPTPTLAPTHTATATLTKVPTAAPTATPSPSPTMTPTVTLTPTATRLSKRVLPVPIILQELPLSCEFAGMRMVVGALLGKAPTEKELIACMPKDPNPNLGFRGDPTGHNRLANGSANWDNYGVYAPAVAAALNKCVLEPAGSRFRAMAAAGTTYEQVARSILEGYPVMVWVTKRQQAETTQVDTPQGPVQLVLGEHVWVVVGYHADGTFEVHDPFPQKSGVQTFRAQTFPNWELFDRMAVFVVSQTEQLGGY